MIEVSLNLLDNEALRIDDGSEARYRLRFWNQRLYPEAISTIADLRIEFTQPFTRAMAPISGDPI